MLFPYCFIRWLKSQKPAWWHLLLTYFRGNYVTLHLCRRLQGNGSMGIKHSKILWCLPVQRVIIVNQRVCSVIVVDFCLHVDNSHGPLCFCVVCLCVPFPWHHSQIWRTSFGEWFQNWHRHLLGLKDALIRFAQALTLCFVCIHMPHAIIIVTFIKDLCWSSSPIVQK